MVNPADNAPSAPESGYRRVMAAKLVAEYIPSRARQIIYSILALAVALELIWDLLPAAVDGKLEKTLVVLGFGMAASQTGP